MKPLLGPIAEFEKVDAEATRSSYEAAREGSRGRDLRDAIAAILPQLGDHPTAEEIGKAIARFDSRGNG